MFRNLKISTTLLGVVVVFFVFQLLLGGLGYVALDRVGADVRELHRNSVVEGNAVSAASLSLVAARTDFSRYATRVTQGNAGDKTSLNTALAHVADAGRHFARFDAALTAGDRASSVTTAYIQAYRQYETNLNNVARVLEAGDMTAYLKQGTQGVQETYMKAQSAFMASSDAIGESALEGITDMTALFSLVLAGVLAAGLALAVGVFVMIRRIIVQPLRDVGELFKRIAAGNLANRVPDGGTNEIGALLAALKTMQEGLVTTVRQVRQGVEEIHVGTREISAGNTDLSARTEQQAASLEETAASMEELASAVKQNNDSARQASDMATQTSQVVERGHAAVGGVVDTMQAIAQSSSRIGEIVGVIDSIAFQTNILALNAAVEAARAGEQGKGFAVVASEVRSLAQRSAGAAREIKDLIEDSSAKVGHGARQVDSAGATMSEILDAVRRVTGIMGEISMATQEQASGIDQVNLAVSQMDSVTQQNAALVEEAAAAAGSLASQANRLREAVAVFRLPESVVIDTAPPALGARHPGQSRQALSSAAV
ncbi:Methyl-accepting chemotaxis protein I (serine chemoreceptor protein) [plant metagenome]|uniref:Methyl-accepting chemotaxis protein I (Serine chemoreceptor protein) n=1 Tax=plant metagenome TaxID=1297885 RepID=A0A484NTY3_9ZZZZ